MELDAVLRERRSMRKYQPDRKVSREQVEEILKAATLAPSWKNCLLYTSPSPRDCS